ncbi:MULTISPECIES: hypothetical protein [Paenibacillus]|uniref:hypothetical protein n=1 Tax=Paenibacillus TaxID=44249 RepID=UPI0003200D2A|nr:MULTISPECIES: hypothetical protein [Paenibacillus]KKD56108.1 hypothetical protein C400_04680 [Paenibacillus sp. ICGEB2008]MBE3646240.1 hypothetical protein [Paenibacillus polymyxa]MEE4578515.1 hypothetical protein [Paenibacillus polymyxa]PNQ87406.1 hypothetical protein C1T20_02155 [Paenibacillus polymyxa]UMR35655.1 hypothetical protein MJ749_24000 [Paenibacillus polymyxa]
MFRKNKFFGMGLATILMCSAFSGSLASAEPKATEYDASFFENLKQRAIVHELQEHQIAVNPKASIAELLNTADSTSLKSKSNSDLQQNLEKLNKSEYIYLTLDGKVYSSEKGYVGMADKVESKEDSVTDATYMKTNSLSEPSNNHDVSISSKNNPTPSQVSGGTTGAFSRVQLKFDGFDGVTGNFWLPYVHRLGDGEQPWFYFGFDSAKGRGVEGGFSYQTGRKVWQGYVRNSNRFEYSYGTWSEGAEIKPMKFYIDSNSGDSYLIVGSEKIVVMMTFFDESDFPSLSLKRVFSIAKNNFDGNNIYGAISGDFYNLLVSKVNSDYYYSWGDYPEYSLWDGEKWHGTIAWPTYYIKYYDPDTRMASWIQNQNR